MLATVFIRLISLEASKVMMMPEVDCCTSASIEPKLIEPRALKVKMK
jgi:hypothetical protein